MSAPTIVDVPPEQDGTNNNNNNNNNSRDNRNNRNPRPRSPFPPPLLIGGAIGGTGIDNNNNNNNITNNLNNNNWNNEARRGEDWRERERRQRSVRFLMMFLLMLLLMDGEEQQQYQRKKRQEQQQLLKKQQQQHQKGEKLTQKSDTQKLFEQSLYQARRRQDAMVQDRIWDHVRFRHLISRNYNVDVDRQIRQWATDQQQQQQQEQQQQQHQDLEKDQLVDAVAAIAGGDGGETSLGTKEDGDADGGTDGGGGGGSHYQQQNQQQQQQQQHHTSAMDLSSSSEASKMVDPEEEKKVWHYPWNATGFYRGDWSRDEMREKASKSILVGTNNRSDTDGGDKQQSTSQSDVTTTKQSTKDTSLSLSPKTPKKKSRIKIHHPDDLKQPMMEILQQQVDPTMGVYLLPPGIELQMPNGTKSLLSNSVSAGDDTLAMSRGAREKIHPQHSIFLRGSSTAATGAAAAKTNEEESDRVNNDEVDDDDVEDKQQKVITLTMSSGHAAFQLYSRPIPAMKELSMIEGFVKLYDSKTVGYSTRRDILLRVRGVLFHSLGRISLVANTASTGRAAFVLGGSGGGGEEHDKGAIGGHRSDKQHDDSTETSKEKKNDHERRRRRLLEMVQNVLSNSRSNASVSQEKLEEIREAAVSLFHAVSDVGEDATPYANAISTIDQELLATLHDENETPPTNPEVVENDTMPRGSFSSNDEKKTVGNGDKLAGAEMADEIETKADLQEEATGFTTFSKYVIPYPFVWDDEEHSLQKNGMPSTARPMPPREQMLEVNAGSCEFEINLNVQEEEWTVGQWRKLMSKRISQAARLDPSHPQDSTDDASQGKEDRVPTRKKKRKGKTLAGKQKTLKQKAALEQALIMTINGTIVSSNCDFVANVNATAIRTDWEQTTGKAINYSFYMMLTCLTQIVLLLRQLLHTQAQSAAIRVSLMCIGWQTVVDALLCLVHIYLSLAMQPLFTAFASVAFFKLLIFCVIEMKYMAIIIQARNAHNGGNTIELLRRQIAMLHLRFYVALMTCCLGFLYCGETYRTPYMLLLYSFWVPQIIQNIITETKRPLHPYYVYGMSVSRLVAPLYIFAIQNNFLKEVYPESPTNFFMCQLLVLWVGVQVGILEAQGRYGARFMIPALFLPPKFNYQRPIPASLLAPPDGTSSPSEELQNERNASSTEVEVRPLVKKREVSPRNGVTRNRIKGNKASQSKSEMTAETVTATPRPAHPKIDCVICYNGIDTGNPSGYMLSPCDHIFHKDCLVQWMEVKMECPICRKDLPAL